MLDRGERRKAGGSIPGSCIWSDCIFIGYMLTPFVERGGKGRKGERGRGAERDR